MGFWQISFYLLEKVLANKFLFPGTFLANKFLFPGTVPANKFLFSGTVPLTKRYLEYGRFHESDTYKKVILIL